MTSLGQAPPLCALRLCMYCVGSVEISERLGEAHFYLFFLLKFVFV